MANYRTPELARQYGGGAEVVEVTLTNGRVAYTTDPTNRYVASVGGVATEEEEKEEEARSGSSGPNVSSLLRQFGLDELIPMVDTWVRQGMSWAEIEGQLLDASTPAGKVVDRLYPEIRLRREKNLTPVSIADIQGYRTNARELMRASGVPEGFFDDDADFTNFIVNDVGLIELRDRVQEFEMYGEQLSSANAGELEAFERMYGVRPTAFEVAALALNPDKALPAIQRQFRSVGLDVQAGRAGFGDLSRTEAERLADVGVSADQANQGFSTLAASRELFDPLPGLAEDAIGRQEQLGAAFEGNANARRRIERRAQGRVARFQGGGGFASGREGFEGVGSADR